jgi:hypothetical protein
MKQAGNILVAVTKQSCDRCLFDAGLSVGLPFEPEGKCYMFL